METTGLAHSAAQDVLSPGFWDSLWEYIGERKVLDIAATMTDVCLLLDDGSLVIAGTTSVGAASVSSVNISTSRKGLTTIQRAKRIIPPPRTYSVLLPPL